MIKQIFLDCDGILADFEAGVRHRFGCDWWYPTEYEIPYEEMGFTKEQFWRVLDEVNFWRYLPWTHDAKKILSIVEPLKPVLLTHCYTPQNFAGRIMWIQDNLPKYWEEGRVLLGHESKTKIAHPGALLIDDCTANCKDWIKQGGKAILYPRPWNDARCIKDSVGYLKYLLGEMLRGDV